MIDDLLAYLDHEVVAAKLEEFRQRRELNDLLIDYGYQLSPMNTDVYENNLRTLKGLAFDIVTMISDKRSN